jgi:O-antigen ligase
MKFFNVFCRQNIFSVCFIASIIALFFSFIGFLVPVFREAMFFAVLSLILILSIYKLEYGLCAALVELVLGSKGYLFYFEAGGASISLRIGIFLVVMGVFLAKLAIRKIEFIWDRKLIWFFILLVLIGIGFLGGVLRGLEFQNVFLDANGYFYLLYLFPFLAVFRGKDNLNKLTDVLLSSGLILAIFSLFLFYVFSHDWLNLDLIYKWQRVNLLSEITFTGSVYRIFLQSQIFLILVFFLSLHQLLEKRNLYLSVAVSFLSALGIFVSLSRSFFLGFLAGLFVFLFLIYLKNKKESLKMFFVIVLICFASVAFLWTINKNEPMILADRFLFMAQKGIAAEPASLTREEELKPLLLEIIKKPFLGWGFGKTVEFITHDPRALTMLPQCVGKESCLFRTYAFEWGYLDLWLKLGLFGLVSLFGILYSLFKQGRELIRQGDFSAVWLLSSLAAVCVTNIFTPYLNHPLGLGILILVAVYLFAEKSAGAP